MNSPALQTDPKASTSIPAVEQNKPVPKIEEPLEIAKGSDILNDAEQGNTDEEYIHVEKSKASV